MAAKRTSNSRALDNVSIGILQKLKEHFVQAGLDSGALAVGYAGASVSYVTDVVRADTGASQVDFDLSLKELEERKFVTTGPLAVYDNQPNSGVFILGTYSKREYACLTEAGYRMAQQNEIVAYSRARPSMQINISGGNFHQSQIAAGEKIAQQQRNKNVDAPDALERLIALLAENGVRADDAIRADLNRLVNMAEEGNLKEGRALFQKVFGFATEAVKQTAWGILTALLTKAMGL